jgi:uncharacterized membrane protein
MPGQSAAKVWGKARVEALSDGVFAIAVTLLVLDIRIPELPRRLGNREAWHAIGSLGPLFFSFFITFILTGSFWFMHHVTFHSLKYVTRALVFINFAFLMFVSLLPFSTGLLGKLGPSHPVGLIVYFANQLALGLTLNWLWMYAKRHHLLDEPNADPSMRYMIAAQPIACVVALATVAASPVVSYYAYLFVMLGTRRIARRRFKALPTDAPAPL